MPRASETGSTLPVLAAQQRAREEEKRQQARQPPARPAQCGRRPSRDELLGQHPERLDGRTRTELERTVRQALDRELDGSESDADVHTLVEEILEEAVKPIQKARRETVRRGLIAHGVEYAAQERPRGDPDSVERVSTGRDVKLALEDEITGTESERDVEALVDDVLDDVLGGTEDDEEGDDETEDDD